MQRQTEEDRTSADIAALPAMNKAQLLKIWEHTFPTPPPGKLRKELMVPILAYRMQEAMHGGLPGRDPAQETHLSRAAPGHPEEGAVGQGAEAARLEPTS